MSTDHARELRPALARYIEAGRRFAGNARRPGAKNPASGINNTGVRA